MLRAALLSLNLLFLAAPADPVTVMGKNVLPKTDLVVRGVPKAESRLGFGAGVTRFAVSEVILGREKERSLLVLSADDAFFGPADTPTVAFLHRLSEGRYEGVARVDLTGEDAETKLAMLRRYLEIEAIEDADEKREALHDLLMENLTSGSVFLVWSAARELAHYTGTDPDRFTKEDAATIRDLAAATGEPVLRSLLDRAAGNLGGPGPAGPDPAAPDGGIPVDHRGIPAPVEFRRLAATWKEGVESAADRLAIVRAITAKHIRYARPILLEALSDPDADVREAAARGLGEGLFEEAREPLRRLLARERDKDVVRAAIGTLGYLKDEGSLPLVIELAKDPEITRTGAFAAARIGGPLARDWLATLRTLNAGGSAEEAEMRKLLDFLASEDFVRQEEALEKVRRDRRR